MDEWQQNFLQGSPMFSPLRQVGAAIEQLERWPTLAELNALLSPAVRTASGIPLRFVPQGSKPQRPEDRYEARIYLTGEVQTRTENWHDLFNALVWLAFPRTKAALNARHYAAMAPEGEGNRSRLRDMLTLFDESGVLVVSADETLSGLLCDFEWQELFVTRREAVSARMQFVLFGHSLYEKALRPYLGLTGKGMILPVRELFPRRPDECWLQSLDEGMTSLLAQNGAPALTPLPLLGVPGWWADNESAGFYQQRDYFREKRRPGRKAPG